MRRIPEKEKPVSLEEAEKYIKRYLKDKRCYKHPLKQVKSLGIKGGYLEIDFGPAIMAMEVAKSMDNIRVTGIERCRHRIDAAEKIINEEGLEGKIRLLSADAEKNLSPEELGEFDLIYCVYTLHHWQNPKTAISNLLKHLKKNGLIFIYDLKRVPCLYYLPLKNNFLNSVRASYTIREIKNILGSYKNLKIDINEDFLGMGIIIKVCG
ncbi:MAG: methyltransferase domain-containing protein [Candidatus Omnitrophica bacterium]|nr:methyltransferase domain-containing protein [Candidatus Omnitrophota bacterium]MBD3268631.1 methyltransferase domain-containing protein [Candidatus Omnitrophota bacterium]